ncbi:hypothetical protein cyc_03788 [Cyclospora cayetanensis]|uniref:Secreted protein n=1 Tax=Cyclospora cayetanensis TaxID=88456 RepID=A0A1D3D1M6_9EIME|nr:hypothetical protein cyc_03788 [Cyclospora cayetanensis]
MLLLWRLGSLSLQSFPADFLCKRPRKERRNDCVPVQGSISGYKAPDLKRMQSLSSCRVHEDSKRRANGLSFRRANKQQLQHSQHRTAQQRHRLFEQAFRSSSSNSPTRRAATKPQEERRHCTAAAARNSACSCSNAS